jgi:hypothetical protein
MLNNCNSFSLPTTDMPATSQAATIDGLMQAITTCDLAKLETYIREFKHDAAQLLPVVEALGRLVNSRELKLTARKFSWKQRGVTRWAVVCEFNLIRAQRILLVPTEQEFPSVVLAHNVGTVGVVCTDCPKVMMRQVGRIAGMPPVCSPPPLAFNTMPSFATA